MLRLLQRHRGLLCGCVLVVIGLEPGVRLGFCLDDSSVIEVGVAS